MSNIIYSMILVADQEDNNCFLNKNLPYSVTNMSMNYFAIPIG